MREAGADVAGFVRRHTAIASPPLVPEIRLHMASEVTPLWQASEDFLERTGIAPPFWAFAWVGGQALARHILDRPETVRGRRVFDVGTGGGMVAIAARLAGAARVTGIDVDPVAIVAARLNARLNAVDVALVVGDAADAVTDADVVLAGDVCYDRADSARIVAWLAARAAEGRTVLLGDPGRAYLPQDRLVRIAGHAVPTTTDLEDSTSRETGVWRLGGA